MKLKTIDMNDKDLVEFFIYLRDYCYNRDFQIAPDTVVADFREHQFKRLHKPVVMQAEGSDGVKEAAVGQRSGGTGVSVDEIYCDCGRKRTLVYYCNVCDNDE